MSSVDSSPLSQQPGTGPCEDQTTRSSFGALQPDCLDFFNVDIVLLGRLSALFFIRHYTRTVRIARATAKTTADRVTQQARDVFMEFAEQARAVKFLHP